MRNLRATWGLGLSALLALGAGVGCGGDDDGGSGGSGGATGGSGGTPSGGSGGTPSGGSGGTAGSSSGGTGGVAGGGGAAGSGGSAGASGVDCKGYCDTVMADCTGGDAQYANTADCLAVCASFPEGSPSDQSGNSFYCREYHAGNASSNPSVHCPHAGPAGDGVCGSNCDGYCNIMMKHCSSVSGAYTSLSDCSTKCAGITGATSTAYDTGTTSGDSLFCRIYHATVAATNPTVHCPHSIETPTAQCI